MEHSFRQNMYSQCTVYNKKHLKNAHSPLRAASRPFTRCRYCRTPPIAIAQAACDVHDNNDDNNDNAWQRGPLWPHRMGPMILCYIILLSASIVILRLKSKVLPDLLQSIGFGADQCTGSQSTGDFNPSIGDMLPLLSARPAVTFPSKEGHRLSVSTKLYCLVTDAHWCEQLAQGCYSTAQWPGLKLTITESPVRCLSH